jgi:iron complex outermembrane receptor protein
LAPLIRERATPELQLLQDRGAGTQWSDGLWYDIALRVPSVSFVQINNGESYISMRGTLINTPGAGWSDAVTVFIDDVPMTGMADDSPDLYDLKSIEVLRGPQGTLFGTNVTGGALVIHTQ